jgi:nucleoside 2-deoxyribosyltransferase
MKIYLAAQYSWRDQMKDHAKQLTEAGFVVTSSWLRERSPLNVDLNEESDRFLRGHAENDLRDITEADIIISFTVSPVTLTKRGGRHVEFGIGLAQGKQMIVCGPKENIFHYLPEIKQFNTFEATLKYLTSLD